MQNALLAEINNLSVTERILLVEDIWDHLIDTDDSAFALSDTQCAELDRRITHYQDQPEAGRYWNDVKEEYFRGGNK
jgi:putative addiction module component (TIGR02574 family)